MWHSLITPRKSSFAQSCHEPFAPFDQRARYCCLGWMDAGLLAKGFQDLISSAFSSCQTSSLPRTEGGFFTLVLLNCDAPRMLQRISQTGKIIHRSISCCRRRAATDQEGLMPGATGEGLRLHLALAAPAREQPLPLSMVRAGF